MIESGRVWSGPVGSGRVCGMGRIWYSIVCHVMSGYAIQFCVREEGGRRPDDSTT